MTVTGPAYCEVSDVIDAMTSYNAAGTPAEIDPAIVQLAIVQASSKVSSWTSEVWPTDTVPSFVQSLTVNIAAYYATLSYRKNKPLEANDPILLRYNDAMADLKAINTGQINPDPYNPVTPGSGSRGTVRNTIPKVFTGYDSNTHVSRGGYTTPNRYPDDLPWLNRF